MSKTIEFYDRYNEFQGRIKVLDSIPIGKLQDDVWELLDAWDWLYYEEDEEVR